MSDSAIAHLRVESKIEMNKFAISDLFTVKHMFQWHGREIKICLYTSALKLTQTFPSLDLWIVLINFIILTSIAGFYSFVWNLQKIF